MKYSEIKDYLRLSPKGKIEKRYKNGSWNIVEGSNAAGGYKRLISREHKHLSYHRVVYSLYNKCDIPKGMDVDHINFIRDDNHPDNLQLLDRVDNTAKSSKGITVDKTRNSFSVVANSTFEGKGVRVTLYCGKDKVKAEQLAVKYNSLFGWGMPLYQTRKTNIDTWKQALIDNI